METSTLQPTDPLSEGKPESLAAAIGQLDELDHHIGSILNKINGSNNDKVKGVEKEPRSVDNSLRWVLSEGPDQIRTKISKFHDMLYAIERELF